MSKYLCQQQLLLVTLTAGASSSINFSRFRSYALPLFLQKSFLIQYYKSSLESLLSLDSTELLYFIYSQVSSGKIQSNVHITFLLASIFGFHLAEVS